MLCIGDFFVASFFVEKIRVSSSIKNAINNNGKNDKGTNL